MARRTTESNRIAANSLTHAKSNTENRYAVGAPYATEDHELGVIKVGDLALLAIVYAKSAQAAIGRFKKQYPSMKHYDVEVFDMRTKEAQMLCRLTIKAYNDHIKGPDDFKMNMSQLELIHAEKNGQYQVRKKHAAKKVRIAAKKTKTATVAKTTVDNQIAYDEIEAETVAFMQENSKRQKKADVKSNVVRSKTKAIATAKKALTKKKTAKKKTTKKIAKKKITKKVTKKTRRTKK